MCVISWWCLLQRGLRGCSEWHLFFCFSLHGRHWCWYFSIWCGSTVVDDGDFFASPRKGRPDLIFVAVVDDPFISPQIWHGFHWPIGSSNKLENQIREESAFQFFWHVSCNLLSFTIAIVKRGRPVDMNVIPNFSKNLGNTIRLRY